MTRYKFYVGRVGTKDKDTLSPEEINLIAGELHSFLIRKGMTPIDSEVNDRYYFSDNSMVITHLWDVGRRLVANVATKKRRFIEDLLEAIPQLKGYAWRVDKKGETIPEDSSKNLEELTITT